MTRPRPYRNVRSRISLRHRMWSVVFHMCEVVNGLIGLVTLGEFGGGLTLWAAREMTRHDINYQKKRANGTR